jgi:hypothetical protein
VQLAPAVEGLGPEQPVPGLAAEGAGVHPHRPAHGPGDADQELEAGEPGPLRLLGHPLVKRASAGEHRRALGLHLRERSPEADHDALDAAVAHQQVRGDADRQDRHLGRQGGQETR